MKAAELEELALRYPAVARETLEVTLDLLDRLSKAGIDPQSRIRIGFGRGPRATPDPDFEPRTVRLRSR